MSSSGASCPGPRRCAPRTATCSLHAANSAAALGLPEARLDLVRCGIAVYGMDPFHADPARHGLEPALELRSYLAEVKRCAPGESAGYGRRFVARAPTWIGTVPVGYADGVRRALTNDCDVLVAGRRFPLAGTVSMDNLTLDLGDDPPPRGSEVVLLGRQGGERVLAEEWARRLGTINYEITCGISARVPRRAPPRRGAGGVSHPVIDEVRRQFAGREAWVVGGAVRDRLLGRDTVDLDLSLPEDPKEAGPRAGARDRRRRLPPVRRVRGLARGRAGPQLARRPRPAARRDIDATSRRATSRSTPWPSRWTAGSCSTRTAGAPTSRRGGCGWSGPARSPTIPCARCAPSGSRSTSSS